MGEGDHRTRRRAAVLLVVVVVAWGVSWPVNKVILDTLPPLWLVAARSAVAAVALFVIALLRRRLIVPRRQDVPVVLSITLLHMVGFTILAHVGLFFVPTGRSVVLAYTTPLWVTPGASLFLKERLTRRRMTGVAVGITGLVMLFNPLAFDWTNGDAVFGNAVIVGAALLWAASILHIRGHRWHSTPFELIPWEMALATVLLTLAAFGFSSLPPIAWDPRLVGLLIYSGVLGAALPYWAIAMASRGLPAVTTSLGLLGTPVVSTVIATWWLGEALTVSLVAAIVLILGGVAIGTTADRNGTPPATV